MSVVIFQDLTTDEYLCKIENDAKQYSGLWVDMDDKNQRKFVKDNASLINGLLKKLERARIDKSKEYKAKVEEEAKRIRERLEAANKPLTELIDAHKEKRAKELAEIKAREEAEALKIQIEKDHEEAIMMEKLRVFEIEEEKRKQQERDEQIAKEAAERAEREKIEAEERAEQAERDRILAEAKAKRDAEEAEKRAKEREEKLKRDAEIAAQRAAEEAKRKEIQRQAEEKRKAEEEKARLEANKRHVSKICRQSKECFMKNDKIDEALAKEIVSMIAKGEIKNISINY